MQRPKANRTVSIPAYSIQQLLRAVRRLPANMLETDRLQNGVHDTHQIRWIDWLRSYNAPDGGYYGRSDTFVTDARTVYQRLNNGPMIVWLNEASGEKPALIRATIREMKLRGNGRAQTEAKIARARHPWERAASLLFD